MGFSQLISSISEWFISNSVQLTITLLITVVYIGMDRYGSPKLEEGASQGNFGQSVARKAIRSARVIIGLFGLLILVLIWGIDFSSLIVVAGTTITLLGVALFASWSFLSNVTAYFVLLVHPSIRRGAYIRVIDLDNFAEGYISELTLLSVKLKTEEGETMIYPNNLLLSRIVLINPKEKLGVIGKLPIGEYAETEKPA